MESEAKKKKKKDKSKFYLLIHLPNACKSQAGWIQSHQFGTPLRPLMWAARSWALKPLSAVFYGAHWQLAESDTQRLQLQPRHSICYVSILSRDIPVPNDCPVSSSFKEYLFTERQIKLQRAKDTLKYTFHLLIHSLICPSSWGWAKPKTKQVVTFS